MSKVFFSGEPTKAEQVKFTEAEMPFGKPPAKGKDSAAKGVSATKRIVVMRTTGQNEPGSRIFH